MSGYIQGGRERKKNGDRQQTHGFPNNVETKTTTTAIYSEVKSAHPSTNTSVTSLYNNRRRRRDCTHVSQKLAKRDLARAAR